MERIKIKELIAWKNNKYRKPLILWGARQVGKTYLLKELFAKKHFKKFIYIDLNKDNDAKSFFSTTSDASKYLTYIETRYGKKLTSEHLLVFDEVQQCLPVLASLKYFCEDFREIPVIATGSMVRLSLKKFENADEASNFLFPVGKVDSLTIYPVTFEEYLINTNPNLLSLIKNAYKTKTPLEPYQHDLAMNMLYEYLVIGGMPEALEVFIQSKSYTDATHIVKQIYENYISDMDTYNISQETILKTRKIYNNIFSQLNKENKNFKISQIEKGKSNRDYFNAYQWLELSHLIHRSKNIQAKISLPLKEDTEGLFRMYLSDIGLFAYQSKVNQSNFFVKEKRNTLSGIFFENYVANELIAKEIPLFYWTGKASHEFEFIVYNNEKIYAIDVKKSNGSLVSLTEFRNLNGNCCAVKISSNNFGYNKEHNILTIPHYAAFLLANDLSN